MNLTLRLRPSAAFQIQSGRRTTGADMPQPRVVIPIVAAVIALIAWLIWRHSFEKTYDSLVVPLGTFIGIFVLGQIALGVLQGMKEARQSSTKK